MIGTGKSFIGALLAKILHDHSEEKILLLSYTNHALDQFLEDLMDIGIPTDSIVRLGSKSSSRTESLRLFNQSSDYRRTASTWDAINGLQNRMGTHENSLRSLVPEFDKSKPIKANLLDYLEFSDEDSDFFYALKVPEQEDGMVLVGKAGKNVDPYYLYDRWAHGQDPGIFAPSPEYRAVWELTHAAREAKIRKWTRAVLEERTAEVLGQAQGYNELERQLTQTLNQRTADILQGKRIIACTTTAAAMHTQQLRNASPGVVLVEEAGEILESHVLTAMTPDTKQLILIGDHQQLRPKVKEFGLTVEKGDGYDLNRSLFERLILSGLPHTTLNRQHRMCPQISFLVKSLTYPNLLDAPETKQRAPIRGIQTRVIFINHEYPETEIQTLVNREPDTKGSKQNPFEVTMVLKIVRYLAQQGYGTSDQAILTPYLGQLSLLRHALSQDNDPVLNDLDSFDLVKAGLLPSASASHSKRPIKLSTIDNYQGEEADIVVASLTRSNINGAIGFMAEPQRLNVLLSRARNALILIGNANTFISSAKGKKTWEPFLDLLSKDGLLYDGLPVQCERHPDKKMILRFPQDFDEECPDGGCSAPW